MKICLVSLEYPPESGGGGIGTQTYVKAHGLTARGHDVHVIAASWDRETRTYLDGKAVIHRIAEPSLAGPGYEECAYWLAYSAAVAKHLHALSQQIRFNVIQFPEYCGEGFIYQIDTFKHRSAKYVVQCHGPVSMFAEHMGWPEFGGISHAVGQFMERMVIHSSDAVLASSHCTARYCAKQYDYPEDRINVIHSGIDTDIFRPRPRSADTSDPKVLFVGNLAGSKGFKLVLDAVLRLRHRFPSIVLRVIGKGDDAVHAQAAEKIREAGAEGCVEIRGYVPYADLPSHYAWCDIFAGPSDFEPGPGNIYLEAMASGKPVIACNSGGAPEIVRHGVTGLLVPPQDALAVQDAIACLAADPALRKLFGDSARKWAEDNVSLEKYIDRVEQTYLRAVAA